MKKISILSALVFICFQLYAQVDGWAQHGIRMEKNLPEIPREYIQAYYYDESNTVKICRVLLCRTDFVGSGGRASIWVCGGNDVEIDSEGRFHVYGGYGVKNISRCDKEEPVNELEQRFSYKYLDKGIWYYFNTGLDLYLKPEKKSFKDKLKELLFK